MGTIYSVACKDCKVTRDLDKFYKNGSKVESRADALEYAKEIAADSFRSALLVSFMSKHMGHECVFFNEHSAFQEEAIEYKEDFDYWEES